MPPRPRSPCRDTCQSGAHHIRSPHLPIQRPRFHLPLRFARLLRRARVSRRFSRPAMADDGGSATAAPEKSPENLPNAAEERGSVSPAPEKSPENLPNAAEERGSVSPAPEKSPENPRGGAGGGSPSSPPSVSEISSGVGSGVNRPSGRKKPVHSVFGAGMPADVILWRDKKISGGVLAGATAVWVLFELLECHLLSLVCHCLISSLAVLFLWATATAFIKKSPSRLPEVVIPEDVTVKTALAIRFEINRAIRVLREIAFGRDIKKFLGVIAALWILSVVGSWCNFLTLFYIVFILLQTVPVVYEKYEDQVDTFAEKALAEIKKLYAVFDAKVLTKIPRGRMKDKKKL